METSDRFVTFWPMDARLVHTRDLDAPNPGRALCSVRWRIEEGDEFDVPAGQEYLLCATCAKVRVRRESKAVADAS